jgi:hypothetical protein
MKNVNLYNELERNKIVKVDYEDICSFLTYCSNIGANPCGGAMDETGQWLYI